MNSILLKNENSVKFFQLLVTTFDIINLVLYSLFYLFYFFSIENKKRYKGKYDKKIDRTYNKGLELKKYDI